MDSFIEKNARFLKIYCILARIAGWVVLSLGCLAAAIHSWALYSRVGDREALQLYLPHVPWGMILNFIPAGLLALGVSQFIRYMFDSDYQPGWILRYGHQILFLWAAVYCVWAYFIEIGFNSPATTESLRRLLFLLPFLGAKVLGLVGLGQILRRVIPVINESRTLV
jgi:hypothetical protein